MSTTWIVILVLLFEWVPFFLLYLIGLAIVTAVRRSRRP